MAEENGEDDEKVDFTQLTEVLKGLPEGVQDAVKTAIKEASGEQRAAAVAAAAAEAAEDEDDTDNLDDIDVEKLSRTEFSAHLDKRFLKTLTKALKPIQDRLETTSTDVEVDRVRREFSKAKEDFPDFMEWKEEMREIITVHPDLSASRLYKLARAENPEKAKKIDEKSKDGKNEEGEESREAAILKAKAFGGLKPTSGKSLEKDGKKQPKEASEAAWEEVFGSVSTEILGQALEG